MERKVIDNKKIIICKVECDNFLLLPLLESLKLIFFAYKDLDFDPT